MTLGKYTVRNGVRFDNPAWPLYLIFIGEKLIGRQFSYPTEDDCKRIERQVEYESHAREFSNEERRKRGGTNRVRGLAFKA